MPRARVDFFIAGVQKGGTTALDTMLREHPGIQMARVKEVHFFDDDAIEWKAPDLTRLHEKFDWNAESVLRGEATPIYTYWRGALERLKDYNPDARLIWGLRHPTFRAYSHWRMEFGRNREPLGFSEAISSGRSRVANAPNGQHRVFSYVERGFYEAQISNAKRLFPARQLHFFRTDALWTDPRIEIDRIERFLGVESFLAPIGRYVAPLHSVKTAQISGAARSELDTIYKGTISALGALTGLDFEDWKRPDYVEPMKES